jgi:ribonucleoside-diphosphate reductase alpha chain
MLRVIRNHRRAAYDAPPPRVRGADRQARRPRPAHCPPDLLGRRPRRLGPGARARRAQHGYRNAQVTVIAPTGTIGLVMDCDTTGIEPDFALVKFKKLAGGGYFKIINQGSRRARALGYTPEQIDDIVAYAVGRGTLGLPHHQPRGPARPSGLHDEAIARVEKALPTSVRDHATSFATARRSARTSCAASASPTQRARRLEPRTCSRASASRKAEIAAANTWACGTMTVEGAPHLARAPRGLRLRQPLRQAGHALHPLPRATS